MSGGTPCGCGQAACGCCEGIRALTPLPTENRPGLDAIAVRIGTHGSFLATMKARLSTHAFGEGPAAARPLAALGVRDADASVALLDAFATMADVLTFYQERIVNEGYLRTATDMRSVHELARLVGYEPRPGVAASAWLSYTLDANVGTDVTIPAGSQVRTVPGPGELPQIFETSETLVAKPDWNRLGVRQAAPPHWERDMPAGELYLAGTSTRLKPGDPLLIGTGNLPPEPYRVLLVEEDADAARTKIAVERWDGATTPGAEVPEAIAVAVRQVVAVRDRAPTGATAAEIVKPMADWEELEPDDEINEEVLTDLIKIRAGIGENLGNVQNLARARKLTAWAAQLDRALAVLIEEVERHLGGGCDVEALIGSLTIPPAVPPSHPLQLPGSLSDRFGEGGDAGLTMLAQNSPELADQLAAGLEGCRADEGKPPPVSVYALRLRVRLFGHNAPKQHAAVTMNSQSVGTTEIGEWPIVSFNSYREDEFIIREERDRLDLDGTHDGILPRSWLFVDMTAVPVFDDQDDGVPGVAVARVRPWQVMPVGSVQKAMRADYGMTGEVTRLSIATQSEDDGWIRIAPYDQLFGLISPFIADRDYQVIRGTTVYAASELLALADSPIADPLCDGSDETGPIELDGLYLGLEPGRFVMVSGERADIEHVAGVAGTEAAMIAAVVHDVRADVSIPVPWTTARRASERASGTVAAGAGTTLTAMAVSTDVIVNEPPKAEPPPAKLAGDSVHTFIWLEKPLAYCYRRDTVAIHANLVKASHGETHDETLGDGDGARPNQSFTLKHSPLTYLPAATPAGAANTLQLFVNDIRWNSVASFVDLPPTARAYLIRTDHQHVSSVVFGDGTEGARLPTGTLNVTARYRSGLGRAGNVRAGQIQQLVTRPLGVKEVTNPFRASGGADPETRDQARRNAPLATAALGRLVATRDYADFARTFAGIAKADALELSDGHRSVVHVTVAALDDAPLDPTTELLGALRRAYRDLGDPFQAVVVEPRELKLLVVQAGVRIDPDRRWEVVAAAVRESLFDAFGFERRELGEGVASSEVLNVIQAVEGVAMVDLDHFGAIPTMTEGSDGLRRPLTPAESTAAIDAVVGATRQRGVATKVDARRARREQQRLLPAELVLMSRDLAASLLINQLGGGT